MVDRQSKQRMESPDRVRERVLACQKNEITGHPIDARLARAMNLQENRRTLERTAAGLIVRSLAGVEV